MLWNALDTLLSIAGVLSAAFVALWAIKLALRNSRTIRVVAFLAAVLWLLLFVMFFVQLVQSRV